MLSIRYNEGQKDTAITQGHTRAPVLSELHKPLPDHVRSFWHTENGGAGLCVRHFPARVCACTSATASTVTALYFCVLNPPTQRDGIRMCGLQSVTRSGERRPHKQGQYTSTNRFWLAKLCQDL